MSTSDEHTADNEGGNEALVIHVGSKYVCVGFAGDDAPRAVFPAIVGAPKHPGIMVGLDQKETYVGDEAQPQRGVMALRSGIVHHGLVTDWQSLEKLLHHSFYNELRVDPSEHSVLITSKVDAPKSQKERLTQLLFETFQVPAVHIENAQCLALYSARRTTGVVVDIGASGVDVVPVCEGYALPHAATTSGAIGGDQVTDYFQRILTERGYAFTTAAERDVVRHLKETLCAASAAATSLTSSGPTGSSSTGSLDYEMPDGNVITVGDERFRACEVLFQPSLIGSESSGLSELVMNAISKCDVDIRGDLYGNILLCGGGSMLQGIDVRLHAELSACVPPGMRVRVIAPPERKFATWLGGSILASLSTFQSMLVLRQVYDEIGPVCVHGAGLEAGKIKATKSKKKATRRESELAKLSTRLQGTPRDLNFHMCNDGDEDNHGIFAARALYAEEEVLRVQLHYLVAPSSGLRSFSVLCAAFQGADDMREITCRKPCMCLAIAALYGERRDERQDGNNTGDKDDSDEVLALWSTSLPQQLHSLPTFWPRTDREWLHRASPFTYAKLLREENIITAEYHFIVQLLADDSGKRSHANFVPFERWKWARAIVASRNMQVPESELYPAAPQRRLDGRAAPSTSSQDPATRTVPLIAPLLDLANHSSACANAIWYFDASKRSMILRTTTDIAKGEELCYNYGGSCTSGANSPSKIRLPQWKMLLHYGFTDHIMDTSHETFLHLTYSLLRRLANTTAAAAPKAISEAREKVEGNDDDDLEHLRLRLWQSLRRARQLSHESPATGGEVDGKNGSRHNNTEAGDDESTEDWTIVMSSTEGAGAVAFSDLRRACFCCASLPSSLRSAASSPTVFAAPEAVKSVDEEESATATAVALESEARTLQLMSEVLEQRLAEMCLCERRIKAAIASKDGKIQSLEGGGGGGGGGGMEVTDTAANSPEARAKEHLKCCLDLLKGEAALLRAAKRIADDSMLVLQSCRKRKLKRAVAGVDSNNCRSADGTGGNFSRRVGEDSEEDASAMAKEVLCEYANRRKLNTGWRCFAPWASEYFLRFIVPLYRASR